MVTFYNEDSFQLLDCICELWVIDIIWLGNNSRAVIHFNALIKNNLLWFYSFTVINIEPNGLIILGG